MNDAPTVVPGAAPIAHAPECQPATVGGCSCAAGGIAEQTATAMREWVERARTGMDSVAPLARLHALIPEVLRSVKVEHVTTGSMFRVTCARAHGSPITTLDRDLNTAIRLALQELAP